MAENKWLDGDTVKTGGTPRPRRMLGVDTTETKHEEGNKGWSIDAYIAKHIAQGTDQTVTGTGRYDKYGRELATLSTDDGGLTSNEKLIRAGLAGTSGSVANLPDDVASARHERVRNALAGVPDSDENVRNIGQLTRNLNTADKSGRLQGIRVGSHAPSQKRDGNVLTNSLARGVDQTQMMLYGTAAAMANAIGNDDLQKWGEEGMAANKYQLERNQPETSSYKDIDGVGTAVTYAIERVSETAAQLAGTAAAAAVGAGIGAATTGGVGTIPGAFAGTWLASSAMSSGELAGDMKEAGVKDYGVASLITGAGMGALDAFSFGKMGSAVMGGLGVKKRAAMEVAGYLGAGKEIAKAAAKGFVTEGTTEAMQEGVKEVGIRAAGGDTSKLGSLTDRMAESFVAGGMVGGALTGAGRTVREGVALRKQNQDGRLSDTAPDDASGNVVNDLGEVTKGATVTYDPTAENIEPEKGSPTHVNDPAVETKPVESVKEVETKPAEVVGEVEAKPAEVVGEVEAKPAEVVGEVEAKPAEVVGEVEAKPAEAVGEVETKPAEVVEEVETKPVEVATKEPVNSKTNYTGVNLRPLIDATLADDQNVPQEVRTALKDYMTGGYASKEALMQNPHNRGAYVDQYARDPNVPDLVQGAFNKAREQLHGKIQEAKAANQNTEAKRLDGELKKLNTYEQTYRIENTRKTVDFAKAKHAAYDTVVRDINNRHEGADSIVRALRAAIGRNDKATIQRIVKDRTNIGFRNADIVTQLLTTDKTTLEEFAKDYGDGTHTPEQVYDRLAATYLIGQSQVFSESDKSGDSARAAKVLHAPKQQKQLVKEPVSERPQPTKEVLDAKAEKDLSDYVRRAVYAAQRGETRVESKAFESVEDDSGETQVSTVESANDGIDPRNPRQLEALLGATEAGWLNDKGELVHNNAEHKREIRKMYDGLVAQFPDKFKWVISEREGKEPPFHLIKAALKDGLQPMIEAAESQQKRDFTSVVRNMVDAKATMYNLGSIAKKTGNDNIFALADRVLEAAKPTEAQLDGLAAQFGVEQSRIEAALKDINVAVESYINDIDSGAKPDVAAVTAAQVLDENTENGPLSVYLRDVLADLNTKRVSKETINHAMSVLEKEDMSNALPEDVITRLTELGVMNSAEVDNNIRFVNRHAAVRSDTKTTDVLEVQTSRGNARRVNLPRLVAAIMEENKGENLTPAHAFVSAVQEAVARLETLEDSHGYRLENVTQAFNEMKPEQVLYRSGSREVTVADYRGIVEDMVSIQNAASGYTQLNELRKAAVGQMHEVIERYTPEGRDRYRKNNPILWPIPHRAEKNEVSYRIEREQMDTLLQDVMSLDEGAFTLESEMKASPEYQLKDVVGGKDPWNDFISDFLEAVDVMSNDDYSGRNTKDLDYDAAKRTIDNSIKTLKRISAWVSADLRNKRNPEAGVRAGLSKEFSKRVRALTTGLTRSYYRLAAIQRKLTERHYALEKIDELFGTKSTNERTERAFIIDDGIQTLEGEGLETVTYTREDNVQHEFESTVRDNDIAFVEEQTNKKLSRDTRRVFVENMNGAKNFIVYSTNGDNVTVTEFNRGKKVAEHSLDSADTERASMLGDKYEGWLALHYGERSGLPIETHSRVLAIDVKDMVNGEGGLGLKGFEGGLDNLDFAYAQLFGVGELPPLHERIAKVAQGAVSYTPQTAQPVVKPAKGDTINYFDDNPRIKFYSKEMRPLDVGAADPKGLRARNYRTVHELVTATGIKEQVNIIQGSDIDSVRVETVNGEYNIHLPMLTSKNAHEWLLSLGHELGHVMLDPYLNAFDKGTLPNDTREVIDNLYAGVLDGDKAAIEGFADSYAQHFIEPLIGKKVEVNEQSKHILGNIYMRFKRLGQKVVDTLNSLLKDFELLTGRKQKINTSAQKAFLDKLAGEREAMHEHLREVNENLLGKMKVNPKLIGRAIRETLHALRPTWGRLNSISPEVAAMFQAVGDGNKPAYVNLMRRYTRNAQGKRVMGDLYDGSKSKNITKGYKDLIAGVDSENARNVRQWLKNVHEMFIKDIDPNNINAYGVRDLEVDRVPYRLDPNKVSENVHEVRAILRELGYVEDDVTGLVNAAIEGSDATDNRAVRWQSVLSNDTHRARLEKFLDHNGVSVINAYIHNLAKTMSMRQAFGAHLRGRDGKLLRDDNGHAVFMPMAKLNHYVQRMNDTDAYTVAAALRAINGTYGFKMPQPVRKTMGTINAVGNMAVLHLAGLLNIMDSAVPLIMTGDTGTALRTLGKFIFSGKSREEAVEMAHMLGVIQYGVISNNIEGIFSGRNRTEGALNWTVDKYFHLNAMHATTKLSRIMATAAAIEDFRNGKINKVSRDRHLKIFGITQQEIDTAFEFLGGKDVNTMFDDAFTERATPQQQEAVNKLRNAITEYVDLYTLDPSEISDPLIASNPWFMLLTNLKRFAYAYHHTILRGQWQEVKARFGEKTGLAKVPHILEPVFMTALFSLPLALASIWLREWFRDGDIDKGNPFDKDLGTLAWDVVQKSGLLGVGDIVNNAANATEYGTPWWLSATPSVAVVYKAGSQLADEKYGQAFKTVVPLYGKVHLYTPDKWTMFDNNGED